MENKEGNPDFLEALGNLEAYTQDHSAPVSSFDAAKDYLQTLFFSAYRKTKEKQRAQIKKELIHSIGIVKSYLPLIERYRKGTKEEARLAETIVFTLERFNKIVEKEKEKHLTVDLASPIVKHTYHVTTGKKDKLDTLFKAQALSVIPSKQELDTLKMKAIRFIESESEISPLAASLEEGMNAHLAEIVSEGKTVTLIQTWSDLPGEFHRIIGDFKRESKHSIPIKDSFRFFLESMQPGHPYPPQHMGWSLSHWLIPTSILWKDQIPLLAPLIEKKQKTAEELLPKGAKNQAARKLFRFKKKLFNSNKLEYLAFHQELSLAILRSCPTSENEEKKSEKICQFYQSLAQEEDPFELLSSTNQELNKYFIEVPYERMEEARLQKAALPKDREERTLWFTTLYKEERERSEKELLLLYEGKNLLDSPRFFYLQALGPILSSSASAHLSMQLSEKVKIKPPFLSDFDLKIQASAFKHLTEFLEELDEEFHFDKDQDKELFRKKMHDQIHEEIELFNAPSFESIPPHLQELVEEEVAYFHAQFHASLDS